MAAVPFAEYQWQFLRSLLIQNQQFDAGIFKPAYRCDRWNQDSRICELRRNVGNTVTLVLNIPPIEKVGKTRIEWFRGFGFLNETAWKKNKTILLNPKDPPWNMVIGSRGSELRISPITESDIRINYFKAVAHFEHGSTKQKIIFMIKTIPTDLGLVYPGDTITIHMPSFVSLPAESMIYYWVMESVTPYLPSNMQPSRSGATLTISELRKGQEGTLACAVYTNIGVFATSKRFRFDGVETVYNNLIFTPTRPPHRYMPLDKWNFMLESVRHVYGKKDAHLFPRDVGKLNPELLKQLLLKIPEVKKFLSENYNGTRKRKKRSPLPPESSDYFIESVDDQRPDSDLMTDFYLPKKKPKLTSIDGNLNKREGYQTFATDDDDESPMDNERKPYDPNEIYTHAAHKKRSYFGNFDSYETGQFDVEAINTETEPPLRPKPLSFLEQRRQAIRERLYGSNSGRKQGKVSKKRLRTTTKIPEKDDEVTGLPPLQERDKIAMLISECQRDSQCALNADCVKRSKRKPGFCRCRPEFEGNGIFCWDINMHGK